MTQGEQGQTTIEYILLLAIVAGMLVTLMAGLRDADVLSVFEAPIREQYAATYQYGHPAARGPEQGSPRKHPRFFTFGGDNGRIFGNPEDL